MEISMQCLFVCYKESATLPKRAEIICPFGRCGKSYNIIELKEVENYKVRDAFTCIN